MFRQNERNGERGKKKITGAPSLSRPRSRPGGLGKRTKQRVRASSPGRGRVRSLQPAVWWRPAVYLEILGLSIRRSRIESGVSGGLVLCPGIGPRWPGRKPGILAALPPGARG